MKIALITPWYGGFAGGAEVLARKIAENLSKIGREVEVLTTCSKSPFDDWWNDYYRPGQYTVNHVVIKRFSVNRNTQQLYHAVNHRLISGFQISQSEEFEYLKGSIGSDDLVSFVRANRSEYIFLLIPYLYGLIYWAYQATPEHCILIPCLHDEPQAYFSTTREMMETSRLIFNSPEEMALAQKIYKISNAEVCGCGVDLPLRFDPEKFRQKFNIHHPYLLYAGRKDIGKNLIELVNYFIDYKNKNKNGLQLVFIGGGDGGLIPDKDYFLDLGYIDEEDKFNAYAGAFATCLLSKNESFSFVIMESWGVSTPVIVSDDCPVTKGHCIRCNGGLPIRDSDEFCAAIQYLEDHPAIRAKLGSNGREYVVNNFVWPKVIQEYASVLNKMENLEV
jgi:glycosyltransferase involved in cell wall biosynthesis